MSRVASARRLTNNRHPLVESRRAQLFASVHSGLLAPKPGLRPCLACRGSLTLANVSPQPASLLTENPSLHGHSRHVQSVNHKAHSRSWRLRKWPHTLVMKSTIASVAFMIGVLACSSQEPAKVAELPPARHAVIVVTNHDQLGDSGKQTGWYLSEVSHVYYPLVESGYQVDFASPKGGAAPMDEKSRDLNDPDNARLLGDPVVTERLNNTRPLAEIDPALYQLVHFAGGHGAMWDFPGNADIERITAGIYERGGIVSAICHGPAALVDIKLSTGAYLVNGHEVAAFTNDEEREVGGDAFVPFLLQTKLEERGANVTIAPNWQSKVVVSGRLLTGQNPQSGHALGAALKQASRVDSETTRTE